jgi:hypothetical protein
MRPYAPPQLVPHVDVYIDAYGTFASAPEPMNVPFAGPAAAELGIAFMTLTARLRGAVHDSRRKSPSIVPNNGTCGSASRARLAEVSS